MKTAENQLLIFERHFSPEKPCRPKSGAFGIMPWACFSAPLPRGLVEGASAGQHIAAGAAWVDLPAGQTRQGEPSGSERVKAALSATPSCRNGLCAIKSVLP